MPDLTQSVIHHAAAEAAVHMWTQPKNAADVWRNATARMHLQANGQQLQQNVEAEHEKQEEVRSLHRRISL